MAVSDEAELESLFDEITNFTGIRACRTLRARRMRSQVQNDNQNSQADTELYSALEALLSTRLDADSANGIRINLSNLLSAAKPTESQQTEPEPAQEPTLVLTEAWRRYVNFKDWTDKDAKNNHNYYLFLLAHWGNVDVSTIKKKDLREALSRFSRMPKGNRKPYNKMTVGERYVASEADLPDSEQVSPTTIKHLLKLLQSFFSSFLTNELDVFDKSPTDGIRVEASGNRYGVYTDDEVAVIKEFALKQTDCWKKWTLLLGIYTGARAGEVTKFLRDGVKFDKETGRHYFELKEGKTVNAIRKVPVHKELERLGVGEISGIIVKNKATSHWMTKTLEALGLPTVDIEGNKRLYHSFRHTFITKAVSKGCQMEQVQEVVGHSKRAGITSRYIHKLRLEDLLPVIDCIEY
ncbi:tyrosine-type recombinase/integrase [Vibrio albus]|nr:tyrosine-type recombinase/integrase [Vibrio albus]